MPIARADLTLTLSAGGQTQTVTNSAGFVSLMGALDGWNFNLSTGLSTPIVNPSTMDLSTLSVSTSGITNDLTISLLGTGLTASTPGFGMSFGGTLSNATVSYSAFLDNTLLGTLNANTPFFSDGWATTVVLPDTYSLSQVLTIHATGNNAFASVDALIAPVPEPGSIVLLATVIAGIGFGLARDRCKAKAKVL